MRAPGEKRIGKKMNSTKFAILVTIFFCLSNGKGSYKYSMVSIDKIVALLKKHHNIVVKRRWVFQCIHDLIDAGLLSRKSRRGKNSDGSVWQKSSILALTLHGARFLFSKGIAGAKQLITSIIQWIRNNKDKRFPQKSIVMNGIDDNERRKLLNLAEIVTKDLT